MAKSLDPFRFLLMSGWMNQQQLQLIDYLREENQVLRRTIGPNAITLQRWPAPPIGRESKGIGNQAAPRGTTIVTPETLLASRRRP